MKFTPMTTDEKHKFTPLLPGRYKFNVLLAEDAISKAGNEMLKMKLECFNAEGKRATIFDYLMVKSDGSSKKIKGFCESVGIEDKYQSGDLGYLDCLHKSGELELGIESSEQYGDQNKVKYYVKRSAEESSKSTDGFEDEVLPF